MHSTLNIHSRKQRSGGFTLIELVIVLGIIAIVAMAALPRMDSTIQRGQRASAISESTGMIAAARSEAVARQVPISLCPSTDQATCDTNNWEAGWIMFVDDGVAGAPEDGNRSNPEELLRVGTAAMGNVSIRSHNFADAGAIQFDEQGMTLERGTLMICDVSGATAAAAIILNLSGQSRLGTDDAVDAGCVGCVEKDDAAEATCP